jgi:hypothetical protein
VFGEVSEFVQSALDGYSVCLLSYGQTGSGKTHTMQGSGDGPMRGIIPRAMQQVGTYKTALETKGWTYTMQVRNTTQHRARTWRVTELNSFPTSHLTSPILAPAI